MLGGVRQRSQASRAWFLGIAALVVAADQLTKWIIRMRLAEGERWPEEGPLRLVHFTNSGAAFGMLQGEVVLLGVASVVGVVALLVYLYNPVFASPFVRLGLALMLGGAFGNLIDRVRAGEVVDFLKVPNWPAFNIADSSITVGVVVLLWAMAFESGPRESAES